MFKMQSGVYLSSSREAPDCVFRLSQVLGVCGDLLQKLSLHNSAAPPQTHT